MRRRLKVYGGIVLASAIALALFDYFQVETQALAWHLHHGFHAEVVDVRVRVPFSYQAESQKGLGELTLIRFGGQAWHGGGFITIDFRHISREAEEAIEARAPKKLVTRTKVGERGVIFAGRPGTCIEYVPQLDDPRANQYLQAMDAREIACWFSDVAVHLMGTANLKQDFYNIIQTAQPIGRKN